MFGYIKKIFQYLHRKKNNKNHMPRKHSNIELPNRLSRLSDYTGCRACIAEE